MNCPKCQSRSCVIESRPTETGVARKRMCAKRHYYYTIELACGTWQHKDIKKKRKRLPKKPKAKSKTLTFYKAITK